MENWERHRDPQIHRKNFIRRCSQTFATLFRPIRDSYATVTQTPPQSSRPLPPWAKKIWLPIDFRTEIEYLKYIFNYCLTRLDTLDEITPENPVPWDAPSSDEAPPPPQTTPEQKNESTIPNAESIMQSAASNDVNNDENEIEMLTISNKRTLNEDSSEEDTNNPLPAKKAATSSPASEQSGTRVPKGRGGGDLPKAPVTHALQPVGDCLATKNRCNHCAIKTAFFRLQINRRQLSLKIGDRLATGGRLIANWLEMGCDWSATRWRLVGDRSAMSWRLTIEQTICCVGVIMNKTLMNCYIIDGHQHIDYVISFIFGLFSG